MHAQAISDCRSQHQLNLRLLRFTASPQREEPVMLAQDLLAARRPVDALEVVETAMERDPEDADLLLTLGVALLHSDETRWARRVLTQAVSADPEWSEPWRWLGETLHKSGEHLRAMRALTRAKELDGTDQAVARLLKSIGRREELTRQVQRFHERPELVDPALLLQDLLEDERLDDARAVLQVALAEDDEDPDLLLLRSRVERAGGDLSAARRSLSRATELDPGWEEAWSDLEELLLEMGEEDAAREVALSAKEAERAALEEALEERIVREKALADQRALAARRKRAREDEAAAAAEATELGARREKEAELRARQALLARAAAEAESLGNAAAKAALLRATADAKAATARRAREELAQKSREEAAAHAIEEAARERREAKRRTRDEAFQRAWDQADREARDRASARKADREAKALAVRIRAEAEAEAEAEKICLAEGMRRAREAVWQQAKIEAQRRIDEAAAPSPEDLRTAALARAKEELEAHARREARRVVEERAEEEKAARRVADEEREREAVLQKAREAAAAQRRWEATAAAREAAGRRALALAAKMGEDARERASSTPPPRINDESEPVFELARASLLPVDRLGGPSANDVDALLDDLLGVLAAESAANDTLPGMPTPADFDGGVGMTQGPSEMRLRDRGRVGAVAYQAPKADVPAWSHQTVPGAPAPFEAIA